jgi:hypothetical protein
MSISSVATSTSKVLGCDGHTTLLSAAAICSHSGVCPSLPRPRSPASLPPPLLHVFRRFVVQVCRGQIQEGLKGAKRCVGLNDTELQVGGLGGQP